VSRELTLACAARRNHSSSVLCARAHHTVRSHTHATPTYECDDDVVDDVLLPARSRAALSCARAAIACANALSCCCCACSERSTDTRTGGRVVGSVVVAVVAVVTDVIDVGVDVGTTAGVDSSSSLAKCNSACADK
jgi:hypothetical protein